MRESIFILFPILIPIVSGLVLLLIPGWEDRKKTCIYTGVFLGLTGAAAFGVLFGLPEGTELTLFFLTKALPVYFKIDALGKLFACIVTVVWLCCGVFAFTYMKHEWKEKRYFGFYLMVYGVLLGLDFSGNLITFYLFYEVMTLLSMPLVLHTGTKEAVMAGLKYLFYSLCGAYMALFGIYFLSRYCNTPSLMFAAGGILDSSVAAGHEELILFLALLMIMGFGVKAGSFPLHAWLPTAHPAAPAPASAALSGIIVKAGVLAVIRVVYFVFGTEMLKGTWVQYTWLTLSLITVFMGSVLAFREKALKKRLAYSTVSQISYILFGLALMQPAAFTGALFHTVCHAFIKSALFLAAGAMIFETGKLRVSDCRGIGRRMPVTLFCFTFASLSLIGIPPAGGFVSKWYLAVGSLQSETGIFAWLGPVVLLASALLTAGYLLPITVRGFFPGTDWKAEEGLAVGKTETSRFMLVPILLLTVLSVVLGMFPEPLTEFINRCMAAIGG